MVPNIEIQPAILLYCISDNPARKKQDDRSLPVFILKAKGTFTLLNQAFIRTLTATTGGPEPVNRLPSSQVGSLIGHIRKIKEHHVLIEREQQIGRIWSSNQDRIPHLPLLICTTIFVKVYAYMAQSHSMV